MSLLNWLMVLALPALLVLVVIVTRDGLRAQRELRDDLAALDRVTKRIVTAIERKSRVSTGENDERQY